MTRWVIVSGVRMTFHLMHLRVPSGDVELIHSHFHPTATVAHFIADNCHTGPAIKRQYWKKNVSIGTRTASDMVCHYCSLWITSCNKGLTCVYLLFYCFSVLSVFVSVILLFVPMLWSALWPTILFLKWLISLVIFHPFLKDFDR